MFSLQDSLQIVTQFVSGNIILPVILSGKPRKELHEMESIIEKIKNDYEQFDEYEKETVYDMISTYLSLVPEYKEVIESDIEGYVKTYEGYADDIRRFEGEAGLRH